MKRMGIAPAWELAQGLLLGLAAAALTACGSEDVERQTRQQPASGDAMQQENAGDSTAAAPRLAKDDTDQVVSTLVVNFGKQGMSLVDASGDQIHWVVDMEEREDVKGGVAPLKYLRVKGDLTVPMAAENRAYDVGCLFVELKDNVYYREKTWLRMASTGISGVAYPEIKLPLSVDMGGWKPVPVLDDSITLQQFAANTLKKFDATVCFRLDFSNAPADQYQGQLVVQYLRPGAEPNPLPCDKNPTAAECKPKEPEPGTPTPPAPPVLFACSSAPTVLKAGMTTTMTWTAGNYSGLDIKLAADNAAYKGELGTLTMKDKSTAVYKAPAKIPTNARIIATARPLAAETLPAFCEVNLVADEEIGIPDDGEIVGVVGNVYKVPVNAQKLPDLDKMTPVSNVVVPNIDVPDRDFMAGFPGVKDLVEWFAIKFRSRLIVAADTQCTFKVASDDGANLYLDGAKVLDNDGVHPVQSKQSNTLNLAKGEHDIRVDWYQGPRVRIALQLFWKCGNDAAFTIVPPSAFVRPLQ